MAALILPSILTLASTACAEETVKASDVQVTATRVSRELHDVPMSVSVMTEEDIRKSSAKTVGDLLNDIPGVQLIDSGGQGLQRVSIRGEDAFRSVILIDGQKISEHKSMEGTAVLIDPSVIERIEVIKGPASVLYGSDAMGGVINIITKKGGTKPVQGEFSTAYIGSSDGFNGSLGLFGRTGGFSYRANGTYEDHGDLKTPEGTMPDTNFRQKSGSLFLGYDFSDKFSIGGGVDMFDASINSSTIETEEYPDFYVHIHKWTRDKINFYSEAKNLTDWLARVRFDAYWQETEKEMTNHPQTDMDIWSDNTLRTFGTSLQTDWQLGDSNYLIAGYEFTFDQLEADGRSDLWPMGKNAPLRVQTEKRHEGDVYTHAAYAQMETTLPADLTLSYGMRYTWVNTKLTKADGMQKAGPTFSSSWKPMGADDLGSVGSSTESAPVFNAGLTWTGIDNIALRAMFSQGFRVPILMEKYVATSMGGGTIYPNADLDPEKSNNYELGIRYDNGKLMFDAAAFYNDAKDYIANIRFNDNEDETRYTNIANAKTRGFELTAQYSFDNGFTPYASLTWMKRKFDYGSWETYNVGDPTLYGRVGLRYEKMLPKNVLFHADAYGRFANASVDDFEDTDNNQNTFINQTRYGGWGTANFAAGIDFGDEHQYSIDAELLNIFDRTYMRTSAIYEPGLHANLKFSYRF